MPSKLFVKKTPTTDKVKLLPGRGTRKSATFANPGSVVVFLDGPGTDKSGFPLAPGAIIEDTESTDDWWAYVDSGTGDVRVVEVFD